MARSGFFLLAFCAVIVGSGAFAAEPDLPSADPPGTWRRITQDADSTDSKCIGQLTSPLCAVETKLACFTRQEEELCAMADLVPDPGGYIHFKSAEYRVTRYRITGSRIMTEGDILIWHRLSCQWPWRPGDVAVDLEQLDCWLDDRGRERCPIRAAAKPYPGRYALRQGADGLWHVVGGIGAAPYRWFFNGTCYE